MHRSVLVSSLLRPLAVGAFLFGAALRSVFADVVTDWNVAMTDYVTPLPPGALPPFAETRIYALAHIAMSNAIGEASAARSHKWNHHGPASAEAAGAQAAHDVLVHEFPGGMAAFDALLATELGAIPDDPAKTAGIAIGADAAADMLAARADDGSATANGPYTPGTEPGDYRPTPPFDGPPFNGYVDAPKWGSVTPFVLKRGSQFRAPPPYKVTDLQYAFDVNEVKVLGSSGSAARSADQTNIAIFWYESSGLGWNRIARVIEAQHPHDLPAHARIFATLNAALADAYIASFDSKFTYNFWRPITAIRLADSDGNPLTDADPAWEPLLITPPVPDYPSAHAAVGAAAATVLIEFFGDENTFTVTSSFSVPFPFVGPRTFHKISDAAKENAYSRMLVGIHFRLACENGYAQGVDLGTYIVNRTRLGFTH